MRRLWICMLMATLIPAYSANAQPDPYSLGFFFDSSGTDSEGVVPGFAAPTRLYLLMLRLGEQIVGYELGVEITGVASEGWIVTRGSVTGLDVDPSPDGYVVGIGVCAGTPGQPYQINTYDFAYFSAPQGPIDTRVCVTSPTVANPSIPGSASYQTCGGELLGAPLYRSCAYYSFPNFPAGCARINPSWPCFIPIERTSFGALKASF